MTDMEKSAIPAAVFWRRLDVPGHESARLSKREHNWILHGTAVFLEQRQPCRLNYEIICDPNWRTILAQVEGWVGAEPVGLEISVDAAQRWRMNGVEWPSVTGCIDLDLNFSPSTNLLPIRRAALEIGQAAEVTAAWLHFPSFTLRPLVQTYRRTGFSTYAYASSGGSFTAALTTDEAGFAIDYPPVWGQE